MKVSVWVPPGPRILVDYRLTAVTPTPQSVRLVARDIAKLQRPLKKLQDPWSRRPLRSMDSVQFVVNPGSSSRKRAAAYVLKGTVYLDSTRYRGPRAFSPPGLLAHELGHALMTEWPVHSSALGFRRAMKVFRAWRKESRAATGQRCRRALYMSRRNAEQYHRRKTSSRWGCPTPKMDVIRLNAGYQPLKRIVGPNHAGFTEFIADAFATIVSSIAGWPGTDRTRAVMRSFPNGLREFARLLTAAPPRSRSIVSGAAFL